MGASFWLFNAVAISVLALGMLVAIWKQKPRVTRILMGVTALYGISQSVLMLLG